MPAKRILEYYAAPADTTSPGAYATLVDELHQVWGRSLLVREVHGLTILALGGEACQVSDIRMHVPARRMNVP